jgi:hypothetical protein
MLDETENNSRRAKVVGLPSPRITLMTCTELFKTIIIKTNASTSEWVNHHFYVPVIQVRTNTSYDINAPSVKFKTNTVPALTINLTCQFQRLINRLITGFIANT